MPKITPISDLRNYGSVLDLVQEDSPVYLTRNGRGAYVIRDIRDEEKFQEGEAMIRLISELNAGIRAGEEDGWITQEQLAERFAGRKDRS